jgi:hypothetical protein
MNTWLTVTLAKGLDTIIPLVIFAAIVGMIVDYWPKLWKLDDKKDNDVKKDNDD